MKKIVFVCSFFFINMYVLAQDVKLNEFFNNLVEKNTKTAFDILTKNSSFSETELGKKETEKVIEAFINIKKAFGETAGFSPFKTDSINDKLKIIYYFTYHKYSPILWQIMMYKNPENNWILINIQLKFDLTEPFIKNKK